MVIFQMASPERRKQQRRPETGLGSSAAAVTIPSALVTCPL